MRRAIVAALLMFGLAVGVCAQDGEKITIPVSMLTQDQLAKLHQKDLKQNVSAWAGVGKEVGEAINSSMQAITTQSNNFAQTGVGKLTIALVVWRVIGNELVHIGFGLFELVIFIPLWIWSYRRVCITRRLKIDKDKWQVVEYDPSHCDTPPRSVHLCAIALLLAVVLFTVFSY